MWWPKVKIKRESGSTNDSHSFASFSLSQSYRPRSWGQSTLFTSPRSTAPGASMEEGPGNSGGIGCLNAHNHCEWRSRHSRIHNHTRMPVIPTQVDTVDSKVICDIIFKCKYLKSWRASVDYAPNSHRRVCICTGYVRRCRCVGKGKRKKGIVVGSPFLSSVRLTIRIIMFLCHFKSTVWTNKLKPNESLLFIYFEVMKYKRCIQV